MFAVYLESRSGTAGGPHQRNRDYEAGLQLLLQRLGAMRARLLEVTVESLRTKDLPKHEKLVTGALDYPLSVSNRDPYTLRLQIQQAQRVTAQGPAAKGPGNNTKRIRLLVDLPEAIHSVSDVEAQLQYGSGDAVGVAEQLAEVAAGRRSGQGYAVDAAARHAIEMRAMEVAEQDLAAQGWAVEDVHIGHSYDLVARRDGEEHRVEVKGLQGSIHDIILTRNEVQHARTWQNLRLAIVSSIRLAATDDGPVGEGGELTWYAPWDIDGGELEPMQYRWRPKP
jgi:hypothetical protein